LAVMLAVIFSNLAEGALVLGDAGLPVGDRERFATYQDFALLTLVTAVLLAGLTRTAAYRLAIFACAVVALFFTGARNEFLGLMLAGAVLELSLSRKRWIVLSCALAIFATVLMIGSEYSDLIPNNRVMDLVANNAEGTVTERQQMLNAALRTLERHPVLGQYGSYLPGEYAHNVVSVWVDFGIPGLLWLIGLLFWPSLLLARDRLPRTASATAHRATCIAFFAVTVASLIFTKMFAYLLVPIALGITMNWAATRGSATV
jgi:hypothetical protein